MATSVYVILSQLRQIEAELRTDAFIAENLGKSQRAYESKDPTPYRKYIDRVLRLLQISKNQLHFEQFRASHAGRRDYGARQRVEQRSKDYDEVRRACLAIIDEVVRQYGFVAAPRDHELLKAQVDLIRQFDKYFDQLEDIGHTVARLNNAQLTSSMQPILTAAKNTPPPPAALDFSPILIMLVLALHSLRIAIKERKNKDKDK